MTLEWGWLRGKDWDPARERPAGEWISPALATLIVLLVIAVIVAVV